MKRSVSCLTGFVFFTLFLVSAVSTASENIFSLNFDPSDLVFEKVGDYDRISLAGATFSAEPGAPLLPAKFIQVAVPAGLEVERVEVVSFDYQELAGTYQLYPAQPFHPVSEMPTKGEEVEFVEPNPAVYQLSSEYPGELASLTNNGFLGGQPIAGVALYPLQYIPAEGKLVLYTRLEFELILKTASRSPAPVNRRTQQTAEFYSDRARGVVMNPEAVRIEAKGFLPREEEVHYLIITQDAMVSTFQELADWKTNRAILTEVRRLAWVVSSYDGYDDQEKIRNCIRDYYANRGTRWVLLGGDTDILPHRVAPVMGEAIPCDLYFSDLDSNWDANGNHIYGEYPDLVDMYPDVFVGRAPSNDVSQAQTFVDKSLTYETEPTVDYLTRILYAAEVLWPGTDGAECKNYIDSSFVPGYFQTTKLYETSGNLNRTNFEDGLNYGQNIINHNGHGNFDVISLGYHDWYSTDMDNLTNAPRYSLFYTFGCITAAIDMDCIGEHFVNNPNGGGFAYCGNTRYGWGLPGYPLEGPGAEFDIEFFRTLFDSSAYQVGRTLGDSKIPFIPLSQDPSGGGPYYRWTEFTLLLLGDPTLELWTDTPGELAVSHPEVFFAGMSYFVVNVVQDDALVSCVKDGQVLGKAYSSGGSAMVNFDSPLVTMGTMHVTVTKHNYTPYHDTVLVIPPEGPYVIYYSHINDDSQGNNNGVVNPGEPILMPLTVKNIGIDPAYGVSATLREDDDYITLTDSVQSFGDIDSGMTAQSLGDYAYDVDGACPDSHVVRFTLAATDGDSVWETVFFQMVVEPDFVITASTDTALVRQGDSTTVKLILTSIGGFNWQVDLTHTPLPPGVTGFLDPDQLVPTDSSMLRLYAEADAPLDIYSLTITASGGEKLTHEKELVLAVAPPPYYGPVWHVATDGHDIIGNGSEQYPFRTIQRGVNIATGGDTVLVEKGTYVERVNFFGKAILVASHFILDGLEATIDSTVIDGDSSGAVVTFNSGEGLSSVIRGFTITNGYSEGLGGGIFCFGSSPTISENFIVENECGWGRGGPGIYLGYSSNPLIYRNVVANCIGPAAIFLHVECSAQVISNTICDNTWGGLSIQGYSQAYVKNNILCSNVAYGVHADEYSSWDIRYNDVYGQDDNYALIPDQTGIKGNISADPLFVDQPGGDYHLLPGSPCIDAGDPYPFDMGAFESASDPTFALGLVPEDAASVHQGDSITILAIVFSLGGFDLPVDLSFSGLPTGVTGVMDPTQVIPTDTSYFRIQADPGATPGTYPITVTATWGDITRQKDFTLYVLPPSYEGPVWYVSTEGDDVLGNGSEGSPFRTIQKGINRADNGDTVLVEGGVYVENINFVGKSILVASHFILDSLEWIIDATVIDGNYQGSVVTFNSGEDPDAVLTGFTVTKGYASYGSGIYCEGSSPTIAYNFVVRDSSHWGFSGGVGILCASNSHVTAYRNLIADCYGPAAIFCLEGSSIELVNNTIANNAGGGVSVQSGSSLYAKNNISYNNAAYGIHVSESDWDITYNDSYGHDQDWEGIPDQEGVNGNISDDPLFVDPSAGDYHLTEGSPCIDAGDPPGTDMGAFEFGVAEPSFRLALVPDDTAVVYIAYSTDILAIVTSVAGFDQPVDLSYSELPTGVSGVIDPPQVIPTDTAVFTIEAAAHATPGFYPVTVTATGDDITRERQIILAVKESGRVWHVSTEGSDETGDGSAEFPFRTIQKGIDTAEDGDTVLVAKGTYAENIYFLGEEILVGSHFVLDSQEATIESTVIDGQGTGSVVTFFSEEVHACILRGFTLTGGFAGSGGAIHCQNSSPTITENFLVDNEAGSGSALYLRYSAAKINGNLIARSVGPAAVFLLEGCDVEMISNTICDNDWGGVSIQGGSVALLKNNVIYNNAPYGIHATNDASTILYNDVYGHTLDYEGIPDQTGINGNVSEDPLFVSPPVDYHLTSVSPCIDAGDPTDPIPPGGGDQIDMGAFEYFYMRGDANGDGLIDVGDIVYLVAYLFQGGPPPHISKAGDANSDGNVDVADVVYLVNYLYQGGPPPGSKKINPGVFPAKKAAQSEVPAELWLSASRTPDGRGAVRVLLQGTFEVDIAAVQLSIEYGPEDLTLNTALPARLSGLAIYSGQKDGLLKMGIVDLKGETYIPAGEKVDLLILEAQGAYLTSLRIKEAMLVDLQGSVVPVKVRAGKGLRPQSFSLSQNYPNPFNPQTQIKYALPQDCQVRVTVYNLLGQRVRTLVDEPQSAGYKTVLWDGKDEQDVDVASGVYFYKITAGDFVDSRKMLLLK